MEIMEARELLDDATSLEEIDEVHRGNEGISNIFVCIVGFDPCSVVRLEETMTRLHRLLSQEDWEKARDVVTEMKYLEGIKTAAKEKLESF